MFEISAQRSSAAGRRTYTSADVASVALREPLDLEVAAACWGTTDLDEISHLRTCGGSRAMGL